LKPEVAFRRQKLKLNRVYNPGINCWQGDVALATNIVVSVEAAVLFRISPCTADDVTSPPVAIRTTAMRKSLLRMR
jgi:hypothetical protein